MSSPWVHTPNDGRGLRRVFLDSVEVKSCIYADERRGIVRFHDSPPKIHKHKKRIIERTARGRVEVVQCQE